MQRWVLAVLAVCTVLVHAGAQQLESPVVPHSQFGGNVKSPAAGSPPASEPPALPKADVPAATSYTPGEGLTVSMLNGTSTLKLFANVSAIGIFSTDRPFSPGLPLFLLPASPFGLNTNTFDFHARQSNIGANFTGPEFCGLTPSATFLAFIANDSLVADNTKPECCG